MSYNIGQFKRTSLSVYSNIINIDNIKYGEEETITSLYSDSAKDGRISITGGFLKDVIYNFQLKIKSNNNNISHKVIIKLFQSKDRFKTIKIINIERPTDNNIVNIVFTPDFDFSYLVFEIERDSVTANDSSSYYYCSEIIKAETLINVIQSPSFGAGHGQILKQIGIQGPPGLQFVVNGESLKLGRTGIYESNNINVKSLGFVIDSIIQDNSFLPIITENPAFFIVDYLY